MSTRKQFIQHTALSAAAFLLPKIALAQKKEIVKPSSLQNVADQFLLKKEITFLNNATMGPSPKPVVEALLEGLADVTVSALYNRRRQEAIDNLAAFVGAPKEQIIITHNCTEGINMMAWGVSLKPGDEVLICEQEHIGNAAPWLHRANLQKIIVKTVALGKNAEESLALIKNAITKKTKVFALPHIPCTNGQILPLAEICKLAKQKNIITCIDGAHATGMLPLNLQQLGVDYYASSCHKWLMAAQGTGYLYIAKEKEKQLQAHFYGAEGTQLFKTMNTKGLGILQEKTEGAQRFAYGTQSGAAMASITAAVQFANGLGIENIATNCKQLSGHLQEGLMQYNKHITMLTPHEEISRAGIIAFKFITKDTKKFYDQQLEKNCIIRYVAENEINSIRVSTHVYNNKEQLNELLADVKKYIG
jgi:selenocysteine lyase/cysteine desulfurase